MKNIIFVLGYSGSGIASAIRAFEDNGYYCIDNIPVKVISQVVDLLVSSQNNNIPIALGIRLEVEKKYSLFKNFTKSLSKNFSLEMLF